MIRPSVLVTRLLGGAVAASAMLVVFSSQAFALLPDPHGGAPLPGSRMPDTTTGTSSATVLWIAVAIAVLAVVLAAAVVLRLRGRRLTRPSQSSATA